MIYCREYDFDYSKSKPNRFAEKYTINMKRTVVLDSGCGGRFSEFGSGETRLCDFVARITTIKNTKDLKFKRRQSVGIFRIYDLSVRSQSNSSSYLLAAFLKSTFISKSNFSQIPNRRWRSF